MRPLRAELVVVALIVVVIGLGAGACATGGGAAAPASASTGPRTAPEDSDLVDVVPAGPETVLALDVAQLRASPWSRSLVEGAVAEDRAAKAAAQGFDDLDDVDRAVFAISEGDAGPTTLMVARGRFDASRIARARAGAATPWTEAPWRGSRVWSLGDSAVALLTERTYLSGSPSAVREAIDCAWGLSPGVRQSGPFTTLERALATPDAPRGPALIAIASVTEAMRARVAGDVDLPPGLEHVGVRLQLPGALELELVALMATEHDAAAAAHTLDATVRDLRSRKALKAFGLATIFDDAAVGLDGSRVRAHLRLPEKRRDELSAKIAFVLQAIVRARGSSK